MRKLAQAWHPAVFIKEELAERKWTVRDLVFRMKRYESEQDWAINCLAVEMYLEIGPEDKNILLGKEMADEFGVAFDMSGEYFLNLEKSWRDQEEAASE